MSAREDLVVALERALIGETPGSTDPQLEARYEAALRDTSVWVDAIATHRDLVVAFLRDLVEPGSKRHIVVELPTDYSAADRFIVIDTRGDGPHSRLIGEFGWHAYADHVAAVLNASPYPDRSEKDDEEVEPF